MAQVDGEEDQKDAQKFEVIKYTLMFVIIS